MFWKLVGLISGFVVVGLLIWLSVYSFRAWRGDKGSETAINDYKSVNEKLEKDLAELREKLASIMSQQPSVQQPSVQARVLSSVAEQEAPYTPLPAPKTFAEQQPHLAPPQERPSVPMASDLPSGFVSDGCPVRPDIQYNGQFIQENRMIMEKITSPYIKIEERMKAVRMLANRPSPEVAKFLVQCIEKERNGSIRMEALYSLGEIGSLGFVPFLDHLINTDPDPNMRQAAGNAKAKIEERAKNPSSLIIPQTA